MERITTFRLNDLIDNRVSGTMQDALKYLSMWAFTGYDKVMIFNIGMDLNASFTNTTTGMNYFIAGIYDKDSDTYSFHS